MCKTNLKITIISQLLFLKRGLPEKRAGVRAGRPDQSLGFKNFHPGEEGQKKKRDNHLVKKPSFYDDICEPVGSNCGLESGLSRSIEQREIHIQNNIQTR